MKTLKKIGNAILTLILLCVSSPWLIITSAGGITGTFVSAFMTGFKKGTFAYTKIKINLAYLRTKKEEEKPELKVEN